MYINPQEWLRSSAQQDLYRAMLVARPQLQHHDQATHLLRQELAAVQHLPCELPPEPAGLLAWMEDGVQAVHAQFAIYLEERRLGGPRRYFSNRAHALYFLRNVAPTKLVDGAWLYGLLAHAGNPQYTDLVRTCLEELGEGDDGKNHVLLYKTLLARHGLEPLDGLDDDLYRQGLIQLALGWNADEYLPEIIGFNLGYEQLPLHLLITAYELNELGLDPYYFTLHVTVDNAHTGHARRACQAVLDALPVFGDARAFWHRVRQGSKLANVGAGTTDVIRQFDIGHELVRILARKALAGHGAHSDYCRVGGRSVNDWLSSPQTIDEFLQALQDAGWIRRGEPVQNSRFWGVLMGPRAEMFGVFSAYELQVLHDWIRGADSADGKPYAQQPGAAVGQPSFRAAIRAAQRGAQTPAGVVHVAGAIDPELQALQQLVRDADKTAPHTAMALLASAMSPALHWTPAGLWATRVFVQRVTG